MIRATDRKKHVRFDDALPSIAREVHAVHADLLTVSAFLRAADGRITLVVPDERLTNGVRETLEGLITEAGGAYVDPKGACATPSELFQPELLDGSEAVLEDIEIDEGQDPVQVRVIDRRIVGQDWTRPNFEPLENSPPVVSFYSCKGGVGRSTALAVAAAGLAKEGYRVLTVDLDMEAPGVGALLLGENDLPEFGAIDYLVENGVSGIDDLFVRACIVPSPLAQHSPGFVDVLPAIGTRGIEFPGNLIPKLGRALLDDPDAPLVQQVRQLLTDAAATKDYDAIFVDVRAGLSESSAAALLSLGGDMLLFGVNTPQTFEAYRYLFAHLRRYATTDNWRSRLQMVHAKSSDHSEDIELFREQASDLFAEFLYDHVPADNDASNEYFNFDVEDTLAPHYAWVVHFDPAYLHFDPVTKPEQLDTNRFQLAFGEFIDHIQNLIAPQEG